MTGIIVPDNGTIGSASDTDAISIASDGKATLSQKPTFSQGIANTGTIDAGTLGSSVVFPAGGTGNAVSIATLVDEVGVADAGNAVSGDWYTRNLNTSNDPDSIISSLSSQQFTLGAGRYFISAISPAYKVGQYQIRLYDVTGSAVLKLGSTAYANTSDHVVICSSVQYVHTPTASNTYKIEYRASSNQSTNGLGVGTGWGNNVYTQVIIEKLK